MIGLRDRRAVAIVTVMYGERQRRRSIELDPRGGHEPPRRCCAWPGCEAEGAYRAPKSRDELRSFRWFCLEHVRDYNRAWDFFAGMSQGEIEAYLREDVTWHRPTWSFGAAAQASGNWRWQDPFGAFTDAESGVNGARSRSEGEGRRGGGPAAARTVRMLAVLDLGPETTTLVELKRRYKELAKRHHPDLNGGDKRSEERLKRINEAYTYLLDSGLFA